jgi:hypothetical protein
MRQELEYYNNFLLVHGRNYENFFLYCCFSHEITSFQNPTVTDLVADHLATSKDYIPLLVDLSSVTSGKCWDSALKYTMKTFFLNVINCIFFVMFSAALATTNFATKECNVKQNEMKMRRTLSLNHQGHCPHNSESVKSTKLRTTG